MNYTKNPPVLHTLTGARFIAALLVFLYHFASENFSKNDAINLSFKHIFSSAGFLGVSFFFCLSGFVLCWSKRNDEKISDYLVKRVFRVYPNHIVTFFIMLFIFVETGPLLPGGSIYSGWWQNLLLIQTWFPDPYVFISYNGVNWSLSCEVFFYLLFPVLYFFVNNMKVNSLKVLLFFSLVCTFFIPYLANFLPESKNLPWKSETIYSYWFTYMFPVSRFFEFADGVIICLLLKKGAFSKVNGILLASIFFVFYIVSIEASNQYSYAAITIIPITLSLIWLAQKDINNVGSILNTRLLIYLGNISFSFYLVHRIVLIYGHKLIFTNPGYSSIEVLGVFTINLLVSLIFSIFLYEFVERPLVNFIKIKIKKNDFLSKN